ncbi:MAG: HU family DNA-binding protein [Succinivibrionaceae bacterium]|nr:HU family DNA-binding protein [Succinivibrionaceae bacterium]
MNKQQLIEHMATETGLSQTAARGALDALTRCIAKALAEGDKVQLVGFGTFKVTERAERMGRNPQTGKEIKIPASKTPSFTAGAELKKEVNGR